MVRFGSQREPNSAVPDNEIAEAIDNHNRQVRQPLLAAVRERKLVVKSRSRSVMHELCVLLQFYRTHAYT